MEFLAMHKCIIVLVALIACHLFPLVEAGRQLKAVGENDSKISSAINNAVEHRSIEVLPPATPSTGSEFGDSIEEYKDAFRPSTPGNSPGVRHSLVEDDEDMQQKTGSINNDDSHFIGGDKDDFRRTNPGHSPGVGHALSKNSEPQA